MAHAITAPTIEQAREIAAREYRAVSRRCVERGQHDHSRSAARAARHIAAGHYDYNQLVQSALRGEVM